MAEGYFWELERSAWIKGRPWLDKAGAARRAEILARRARRGQRSAAGLGEGQLHEADLPGLWARWTRRTEDVQGAALAVTAVSLLVALRAVALGLAWLIGAAVYCALSSVGGRHRPRLAPLILAAAVVVASAILVRWLGLDLPIIYLLAAQLEVVSGGLLAPAALSRWYAAGILSWFEAQISLGFVSAAWSTYAWGWTAPAVRRGQREALASERRSAPATAPSPKTVASDPTKLISQLAATHTDETEETKA